MVGGAMGTVMTDGSCGGWDMPGGNTGVAIGVAPEAGAAPLVVAVRKFWSLETSTASSTPQCGQRKLARPWGTLRTAWQHTQGSWIFVGSTPCACDGRFRGCGGAGRARAVQLGGEGVEEDGLGMSCGGSRCAIWHLGQMNSVMPGATARTPWQPAQRTWTGAGGGEGVEEPPAIGGEGLEGRQGNGGVRLISVLAREEGRGETEAAAEWGWSVCGSVPTGLGLQNIRKVSRFEFCFRLLFRSVL